MNYDGYNSDYSDYAQGQIISIEQQVADLAQSTTAATLPAGAAGSVYVADASGNPVAGSTSGDSNGAGLSVTGTVLTVTLPQDLKTTASPTFKEVALTDTAAVASLSITAGAAYVQADFQAVIDKINALLAELRAGKIIPT